MPKTLPSYITEYGQAYCDDSLVFLPTLPDNSINLAFVSPPFALLRSKEYGNKNQKEYIQWFMEFAKLVFKKLRSDGSFVIDLGGAYQKGKPVRSLYNFRLLIRLVDEIGFHLAEDFYWFNPSKLPSPIEWVNKRKIRAKDAVNTVWWLSKSEYPKADAKRVLVEYSGRMKKLLENPEKYYTPRGRPSGHQISESFAKNNGGALPSNLLQLPNSESNSQYLRGCKTIGIKPHPARFPPDLPRFFIRFLTEPDDIVLDFFSGSNTTGMVAEEEQRRWIAIDSDHNYVASSIFRFFSNDTPSDILLSAYQNIVDGGSIDINDYLLQKKLF